MSTGLPVADAPRLAGAAARVRRLRLVLTAAMVLLAAAAVSTTTRGRDPRPPASPARGPTTEVALDVSGSVGESSGFAAGALRRLSRGRGSVGLVIFSDAAQKTLPPGTPAAQLLPFANALAPPAKLSGASFYSGVRPYDANPWELSFTGGTSISSGLRAAREALERDGHRGTVLLISDLGDNKADLRAVRRELVALERVGIELRILALPNALPTDIRWFRRLEGTRRFVHLPRTAQPAAPRTAALGFPLEIVGIAALLALVLAANELLGRSLRWRTSA